MRLDGLRRATVIERIVGDPSVEVTGIAHDTRAVRAGALFCCVRGGRVDGHDLAGDAVSAGAVALLCEREVGVPVPQAVVADTRVAMGPAAAAVFADPSRAIDVVGVTGTNGKTTTAYLLQSILEAAGRPTEVIGTLSGARTTPEAPELQALLAGARDRGMSAVAMEASSHALSMHRVDGTWFAVGIFTNLSRDHLDFHASMEAYYAAKASLFEPHRCGFAVVNVEDAWGRRLVDEVTVPWEPYGIDLVQDVVIEATSSRCRWEGAELLVPLGGRFNLSNALAAAVAARHLGVAVDAVAAGLAAAGPVAGRFEPIEAGQPFRVIVDFAHTPDGLEQALRAARWATKGGGVHVVFGCGGERDPSKRAPMGMVAVSLADRVIITSDNPRSEDPDAIINAIISGIPDADSRLAARALVIEPDRRAAIATALSGATPGDVVIVTGKGHETTQTTGAIVVPFDDRVVARELLEGDARW
ncbi:MAG: UDP-N-acetylmuramoyl-L-alanyl-D-glutamate--2,6-diaminopimelate ligase [Acidimicrobiales bacterium]